MTRNVVKETILMLVYYNENKRDLFAYLSLIKIADELMHVSCYRRQTVDYRKVVRTIKRGVN